MATAKKRTVSRSIKLKKTSARSSAGSARKLRRRADGRFY